MTSRLLKPAAGLAAALMMAAPSIAGAANVSAESKAVWDGHLQKALSGDLDAVMTDFTAGSVIITADKTYAGDDLRAFLGAVISGFTSEVVQSITVQAEVPHENIVYTKLTMGALKRTFIYTALIEDGKILVITETDYPAE